MNWQRHISVDPGVCNGRACVTGTRVTVASVLDNLADGIDAAQIMRSYPPLTVEDVRACIAYAAALAHDEVFALAA